MKNHPIQPLEKDSYGVLRFKKNEIVCYLLDSGGIDMNMLAMLPFSDEDRQQFAQLIGYSVSGFNDLSYVSDVASFDQNQEPKAGEALEQPAILFNGASCITVEEMEDELEELRRRT